MADIPYLTRSSSLVVALIVPDMRRRRLISTALTEAQLKVARELDEYPSRGYVPELTALQNCQVVIVDLDDAMEQGLGTIEDICSFDPSVTVMAYSSTNDAGLMRRSMHAGAREFLVEPLGAAITEAFTRTASRRPVRESASGKLIVFVPAKGGLGVTTIAANFALALRMESDARVAVIDMDFQLGGIAPALGINTSFSVVDALTHASRLDRDFLSTLLVRHKSGLAVLSSSEHFNFFHPPPDEGAYKLFRILREEFDYVVVDAGTCHGHIQESIFGMADRLYLVAEMSFPALRNAHRMIEHLSGRDGTRNLEVVLNRFNARHSDIDEESAVRALGRPIRWKIPNAYAAAKLAQDSGVPLALQSSPITKTIFQMADAVCGKPVAPEKKTGGGFNFFGFKTLSEPADS